MRARRERQGLNQSQVAKYAGVTPPFVSRLEQGFYDEPSAVKLAAVARVLGCSVHDLLEDTAPETDVTVKVRPEKASRVRRIARYPIDALDVALGTLESLGGRFFELSPQGDHGQGAGEEADQERERQRGKNQPDAQPHGCG